MPTYHSSTSSRLHPSLHHYSHYLFTNPDIDPFKLELYVCATRHDYHRPRHLYGHDAVPASDGATSDRLHSPLKDWYYSNVTGNGKPPSYYYEQPVLDSSTTNTLALAAGTQPPAYLTYAGMNITSWNFTLVLTGYYSPPTTGEYTFCVHGDDVNYLYVGAGKAFACDAPMTPAPPDVDSTLSSSYFDGGDGTSCGTESLVAGYLYPIRSVYGNAGGPYVLTTNVTTPGASGPVLLDSNIFLPDC
ncbi:hypothetical protein LEL_06935 [Akanthomyces lecanii RCEF 1005]|uniref:PA14 domain-containing protein n=1 Tax=Akanthomyces lecanii RCEF 1005 TaxID=1081108 RepID=A0A168FBT3_CORDF|nr:hypothetical protein LEL_06935 [Akanthomyces lecanii RCEF 1005]